MLRRSKRQVADAPLPVSPVEAYRRRTVEAIELEVAQPAAVVIPSPVTEAARVEAELQGARQDLAEAEVGLANARAAYDRATDSAALSDALRARGETAEAEVAVDIGRRIVERLEAELVPLLDGLASAEALAERERLRTRAADALRAYEEAFRARMPEVAVVLRSLVRAWAEAELAREEASAVGVQFPHADAFRDQLGTPRVEVSRRERDLWINGWGNGPFGDQDQQRIRTRSDGCGTLSGENQLHIIERKRRYAEVEFYPPVASRLAPTLAEVLVLPSAFAGDPAGWTKPDGRSGFSPRAVLAQLQALEAAAATPLPAAELRKELRPLEPARSVMSPGTPRRISMTRSI